MADKINKILEMNKSKKVVLAPMAGITDGEFCKQFKNMFAIATLGGYNIDLTTYEAGLKIEQRGRKEFLIDLNNFNEYIVDQIKKARESNSLVSVNVRFFDIEEAYERLEVIAKHADVIEVNCHCRQREITSLGLGQELMRDVKRLERFLNEMNLLDVPIFLKIRLNYIPIDKLIKNLDVVKDYFTGLHVDCFYPGRPYADLSSLEILSDHFKDKVIIGNNSVDSLEKALEMLKYADFVSVARAVLNGKIDWIKEFNKMF
ncbi:MAG: hypothetical protein GXN95_01470 [Methanococci archaeon]|nr:hypothetical protein [Methanococci archaeon]